MTLDIVIVNWNAGDALASCVESIAQSIRGDVELQRVVVVDNASRDGSADRLSGKGIPLQVIRNTENHGFATACNQGARESQADYILFLNPDTQLFPDSLVVPLEFMEEEENRQVGIVGVQLIGDNGEIGRSCARFPDVGHLYVKMLGLDRVSPRRFHGFMMEDWDHESTADVDHVMGAFFLVRRKVFEQLQGFDERFFVYFEDLDFSLRAAQGGWRSVYLTAAQAYHKGCGTTDQAKAIRLFYSLRSRILYVFKHYAWHGTAAVVFGTLFIEPFARFARAALRGSAVEARETLQGSVMFWRAAPSTLATARGRTR